jgi:hypothetical protein
MGQWVAAQSLGAAASHHSLRAQLARANGLSDRQHPERSCDHHTSVSASSTEQFTVPFTDSAQKVHFLRMVRGWNAE